MKRRYKVLGAAFVMAAAMAVPAFAGTWVKDAAKPANVNGVSNWWYRNDDGSYPSNSWFWLDGNQDGISECYRFDANGWMYAATNVDGYYVNGSGAWMVDGVIQIKGGSTGSQNNNSTYNEGKQETEESSAVQQDSTRIGR